MSTTTTNNILREYAATANNPQYKGNWEVIDSKFPELKDYDKQVLREYAATANNPEYKGNWDVVDSKFPELFGAAPAPVKPVQPQAAVAVQTPNEKAYQQYEQKQNEIYKTGAPANFFKTNDKPITFTEGKGFDVPEGYMKRILPGNEVEQANARMQTIAKQNKCKK